jgi:hypothetical protein
MNINTGEVSKSLQSISGDAKGYVQSLRKCLRLIINDKAPHPFQKFEYEIAGNIRVWDDPSFHNYLSRWSKFDLDSLRKLFASDDEIQMLLNRVELNPDGTKSTRQIAKETGKSKSTVHRKVSRLNGTDRQVAQYNITQYTKPETAAQKIREKFGDEFAKQLAHGLSLS